MPQAGSVPTATDTAAAPATEPVAAGTSDAAAAGGAAGMDGVKLETDSSADVAATADNDASAKADLVYVYVSIVSSVCSFGLAFCPLPMVHVCITAAFPRLDLCCVAYADVHT